MSATLDVVGVGAAIVDIIARVEDSILESLTLAKGAMTLVDAAQSDLIYAALGTTMERSGGSVANTIAALGALGARSAFIGKRRDDQFGEIFAHDIRATGAHFDTAAAESGEETARCLVMVSPDAQRTMATYLGISGDLGPQDVNAATVGTAGILYLEGYLWDKPNAKAAFREAMRIARENGRQVALSLSDPFCVERHRDSFREIVAGDVDILFANEVEILSLYETEDFDAAIESAAADVAIVAATRSEKGAVIVANAERVAVPAAPIEALIDTTGAGDLFAAGFLHGLVRGESVRTCGEMGCLAASVVIQMLGARCGDELRAAFTRRGWV